MLTYCFPPLAAVGSFRMIRFVRYLPEFGWQPIVLTADPANVDHAIDNSLMDYLPSGIIIRRKRALRPVESSIKFAKRILRRPVVKETPENPTAPQNSGAVHKRRVGMFTRLGKLMGALADLTAIPDRQIGWFLPAVQGGLSMVREHRPDVIFSSGPPHSSHLIAVALKRLTGLPVVLDFRDPWSRTQWEKAGDTTIRPSVDRQLERWCVRHADLVVLNTSSLRDEFTGAYPEIPPERFAVLSNGCDPDLMVRVERIRTSRKELSPNDFVRLCHPGSIYGRRDLRPVISAVEQLSRSGCNVLLDQVGFVDHPERLLEFAEQLGIRGRVVLHGKMSHGEALQHMAAADIFVLCQPGTSVQVPAKLFEMLSFRRPILALAESGGATAQIIDRYDLGIVVPPGDDNAIARGVATLANEPAESRVQGGWQQAMRAFDGRAIVGKLGLLLETSVARTRRDHRRPARSGSMPLIASSDPVP